MDLLIGMQVIKTLDDRLEDACDLVLIQFSLCDIDEVDDATSVTVL